MSSGCWGGFGGSPSWLLSEMAVDCRKVGGALQPRVLSPQHLDTPPDLQPLSQTWETCCKKNGYKMPMVNFTVLDRVHIPMRGGDWNKTLLQHEMRWIRYLNATTLPGLNEAESFRPFL